MMDKWQALKKLELEMDERGRRYQMEKEEADRKHDSEMAETDRMHKLEMGKLRSKNEESERKFQMETRLVSWRMRVRS